MQPGIETLETKGKKRTQERQLKKKTEKVIWENFESTNPLTTD